MSSGDAQPGSARISIDDVQIGDRLRIQDASGCWHDAVADSCVEGTRHGGGPKVHDFPVIWVVAIGRDGHAHRMPWPIESVRREQAAS